MNFLSTKSYQIVDTPPPAMEWPKYAALVDQQWTTLLNSAEGLDEAPIQKFLETHPCMVPGARSASESCGHLPFPAALITQPKLPGFSHKIPDFMWLAADSASIYPVLIEIEAPRKKLFTEYGQQTAAFTQAHKQLLDWKTWFDDPINQQQFMSHYDPPHRAFRKVVPQFVLIFGRRSEFEADKELSKLRGNLMRPGEFLISFDRLGPIATSSQYITVKSKKNGYRAVSIPATFENRPSAATYRSYIQGKEDVVDLSPFMSDDRKAFLKKRFSYWDDWARSGAGGPITMSDVE